MTFCIITHVKHGLKNNSYFAYAPYVREMNVWSRYVDKIIIVAPLNLTQKTEIDDYYSHPSIEFNQVKAFNFLSIFSTLQTVLQLPKITFTIYKAMQQSDHIHLRCPGNMGLLGCILQLFFPSKKKTSKYAGNWDLKAKQPLSYRIQKWILNNTFLTKNMTVLVYGEWENSSINIKPFFTASYYESDKIDIATKDLSTDINFVFVGSLTTGKNPMYAIKLIENLKKKKFNISLFIHFFYFSNLSISFYASITCNKNHIIE